MTTYTITRAMGATAASASTTQNLVQGDTLVVNITGLISGSLCFISGATGTTAISIVGGFGASFFTPTSTTATRTFTASTTGSYTINISQPIHAVPKESQVTGSISTSASIAISGGAQRSQGDTISVSYSGPSGTLYYNSTFASQYVAFNPQTGTLSGGSGSFTVTANQPLTNAGNATASRGGLKFSLRQGSTTTGLLTTSNQIQVFATPSTPSTIAATNVGSTSLTVTASGQVSGTGSNFGTFQVSDPNGHPTNGPWNSTGTTFTGLASGTSFTFYARRVNGVAISSSSSAVSLSTTGSTAVAPTMNASYAFITNGIMLIGSPSGSTTGTVQYEWERVSGGPGASTTGFQNNPNHPTGLGIRYTLAGEWLGSTWRVRARAVQGSSTVFSSYSNVTLPSVPTITAPASVNEGSTGSASVSMSGAAGKTLYWTLLPATDFEAAVQQGSVSLNASGSGTISISPFADQTTESAETGTLKLYVMPSRHDTFEFLGSDTFTINDTSTGAPTITDFTSASASVGTNASSNATVTVTGSGGSGGTAEFNVSESTTAPTANWTTGTVSAPRGTSRYFWARRRAGGQVRTNQIAVPFLSDAPAGSPTFASFSPGTDSTIRTTVSNTSSVNLISTDNFVQVVLNSINSADQYRLYTNTGAWALTIPFNGTGTLVNNLPTIPGSSTTYQLQGRRTGSGGGAGNADFVDISGQVFTVTRDANFTLTASPTSLTEGNSATFTLGAPASLATGTTVGFEITGVNVDEINLSSLTGDFIIPASGSATKVVGLLVDTFTEEAETLTMTLNQSASLGIGVGAVSTSVAINAETLSTGGPDGTSGGTGTFGIEIRNSSGNKILLDSNTRVANFKSSAETTVTTTLFSGVDVRDTAKIGFLTTWDGFSWFHPFLTRSSNGLQVLKSGGGSGVLGVKPGTSPPTNATLQVTLIEY